jgi:hypothetical protein
LLEKRMKKLIIFLSILAFSISCFQKTEVKTEPPVKDKLYLMGIAMLRLNWASVKGNEIRFRYSDLGLPADFSTRERASFMVDGTMNHGEYAISGHLDYDPENRITEPPLDFLLTAGNEKEYLSLGDQRMGVFLDSVFSRYYHPFRGGILGKKSEHAGVEILAGVSRGEAGSEEFPSDAGVGPYYLNESPILRGSENIQLVTRSASNSALEISYTPMVRNRDYFIDYDRGAIIFTSPVFPIDSLGNPVWVRVTYQFESLAGRFTRDVLGVRAFAAPWKFVKFNLSYIADADATLSLGNAWDNRRGIFTLGVNVDSRPLTLFGEFSLGSEPQQNDQNGFFGGGTFNFSKQLRLFFNAWSINADFPIFANQQLKYGYSLYQIFPAYADKNIFLSPFQFTRNIGAELYPFSLASLTVDEREAHAFLEWEHKQLVLSGGWGERKSMDAGLYSRTFYLSSFLNGDKTKAWGKIELDDDFDKPRTVKDAGIRDLMLGGRQRLWSGAKGAGFFQFDYNGQTCSDRLDLASDTSGRTASFLLEYLTGSEGVFISYQKELLDEIDGKRLLDADIYEAGIRRHISKSFFIDSRVRREVSSQEEMTMENNILSLGGGIETPRFRAMGRYEFQLNQNNGLKGRRRLWSLFLFGSPLKDMSLSLNYYKQIGRDDAPASLQERSEEQLNFRLLWRVRQWLSLYSQWRYDTNFELYIPFDGIKSNSLASVQGVKVTVSRKLEFLANYKLLRVWGPIENRKESLAAEIGYLVQRHVRVGLGVEHIDFLDRQLTDADYRSTVGYFKLVVLY